MHRHDTMKVNDMRGILDGIATKEKREKERVDVCDGENSFVSTRLRKLIKTLNNK